MRGLVLVHPSSLDSYAYSVDSQLAGSLSEMMLGAVLETKGPVWILWDAGMAGTLAKDFAEEVELQRPDAQWVEHSDSTKGDWKRLERQLPPGIRKAGVTHLTIGGIWYDMSLKSGCAAEVYKILKRKLRTVKVVVDTNLTGVEDDMDELTAGLDDDWDT